MGGEEGEGTPRSRGGWARDACCLRAWVEGLGGAVREARQPRLHLPWRLSACPPKQVCSQSSGAGCPGAGHAQPPRLRHFDQASPGAVVPACHNVLWPPKPCQSPATNCSPATRREVANQAPARPLATTPACTPTHPFMRRVPSKGPGPRRGLATTVRPACARTLEPHATTLTSHPSPACVHALAPNCMRRVLSKARDLAAEVGYDCAVQFVARKLLALACALPADLAALGARAADAFVDRWGLWGFSGFFGVFRFPAEPQQSHDGQEGLEAWLAAQTARPRSPRPPRLAA
jgi:hypothetical protein